MIKRAKIVRQQMDWRTKSNGVNCEIFTMRHMETYMGKMSGWACGLAKENTPNNKQTKHLNDLRIKYTIKILLHEISERRKPLVKSLNKFLNLGPKVIIDICTKQVWQGLKK
ncbi:hypothetical protein Hanom_Chr17g01543671 [Helianthus anomalus]